MSGYMVFSGQRAGEREGDSTLGQLYCHSVPLWAPEARWTGGW